MSTPADPNVSGETDPNAHDTAQGTASQTEHLGAGGDNTPNDPYAPPVPTVDTSSVTLAGPDGGEDGTDEQGQGSEYIPALTGGAQGGGESQAAPGATLTPDPSLGTGGEGSSPAADKDPTVGVTVTHDPETPITPAGDDTPPVTHPAVTPDPETPATSGSPKAPLY